MLAALTKARVTASMMTSGGPSFLRFKTDFCEMVAEASISDIT